MRTNKIPATIEPDIRELKQKVKKLDKLVESLENASKHHWYVIELLLSLHGAKDVKDVCKEES